MKKTDTHPLDHNQRKRGFTDEQLLNAVNALKHDLNKQAALVFKSDLAIQALFDPDLDNSAKIVFGYVLQSTELATDEVSDDHPTIAAHTGLAVGTVRNKFVMLRKCGYLQSVQVSLGRGHGSKSIHFLGGYPHEQLLEKLQAFHGAIDALRGHALSDRDHSERDGRHSGSDVKVRDHADGDVQCNANHVGSDVYNATSDVQPKKNNDLIGDHATSDVQSAKGDYRESSNIESKHSSPASAKSKARGTRLPDDWRLPKPWGEWALKNYHCTPDQVRVEAEKFFNHFTSASGKAGVKINWNRTWQNWLGNFNKFKRRNVDASIAPDLVDDPASKPKRPDISMNWDED